MISQLYIEQFSERAFLVFTTRVLSWIDKHRSHIALDVPGQS
jgi:hypothetical protein